MVSLGLAAGHSVIAAIQFGSTTELSLPSYCSKAFSKQR